MTADEELNRLEDNLRRLKIEYETYFNGGSPRPPNDLVFRVEKTVKKFSAGTMDLTFRQRFRFNQLTQSYAVHNDLWRKKLKMKEEGIQPVIARAHGGRSKGADFAIEWSDPDQEKVAQLLQAVVRAKSAAGQSADDLDPQLFADYIRDKTRQFKESLDCDRIRFSVIVEEGRVKLRAARAS
ncbi:MAG TPA: MXAN_5187 C-terminal domain-containing protein [Terriglobia bacterium]|nr:MXAN_5187 C-terminal domain-containing protein [Terriglobia bacterium]